MTETSTKDLQNLNSQSFEKEKVDV